MRGGEALVHQEALGGQTGTRREQKAQEHPGLGSGQERRGPGVTGGGVSCGQGELGAFCQHGSIPGEPCGGDALGLSKGRMAPQPETQMRTGGTLFSVPSAKLSGHCPLSRWGSRKRHRVLGRSWTCHNLRNNAGAVTMRHACALSPPCSVSPRHTCARATRREQLRWQL